jgi:hypothetical protein
MQLKCWAVISAFVYLYNVVAEKLECAPISGAIVIIGVGFAFPSRG